MPRRCTICQHPDRPAIDQALVNHRPFRDIAGRFGVSKSAAVRHHDDHLPEVLARAKDEADVRHAISVAQQLKAINATTLQILSDARRSGESELALKAIDRVQRQLEMVARIAGDLDERPVITVFTTPDWLALERVMFETLGGYPDARIALATRLAEIAGRPAMSRNGPAG